MKHRTKSIAIASIFGAVIFVAKAIVPSPMDKIFIVVQALLLALGALLVGRMGATYVAAIGGVLTALWRIALAPFSFSFALLYGLLVDGCFFLFRIRDARGKARTARLVVAMTLSTMIAGLSSYYVTVVLGLVPRNLLLEIIVLFAGTLNGVLAGYFASIIWNKYLIKRYFESI